ncbi:hypothetical protein DVH05_000648 [Phytophthora capsici]|nr:hypothetical protein DVH05_000648 [Phytophthora capsici]
MAGGGSSPETTSTEGNSSPSSASTNPKGYVAPVTKKKRVRRQQVELKYLRELAGKLEHRLEQLKNRRPNGQSKGNGSRRAQHNIQSGPSPVWESIADRQFKERSRVEKQNKDLKLMLHAQTNTAQCLQAKAQRALGDKELIGLTMMQLQTEGPRYWDLGSGDEEGIFADLLTLVAKTHLQLKQLQVEDPRNALSFATWGVSMGEPHLRTDNEVGLVLETHGRSLLPFDVKTTAAAYWKMFSLSPANHKVIFHDRSAVHDDMVARSFTCSSTRFGCPVNVRGKHTCRKYIGDDGCITIVFAGRTGPAEALAPCQEVQLQKTGWIKVCQYRSDDPDQKLSAVVEMHTETLPRFRHGNTGQEQRAREVIDWAIKSHHQINDWCRQTLSEILVEEDWKAFRGGEDMSVC